LAKFFHFLSIIYFSHSNPSARIFFSPIIIYCCYISSIDVSACFSYKYTVHLKRVSFSSRC
jgi:hypothetical protein